MKRILHIIKVYRRKRLLIKTYHLFLKHPLMDPTDALSRAALDVKNICGINCLKKPTNQ